MNQAASFLLRPPNVIVIDRQPLDRPSQPAEITLNLLIPCLQIPRGYGGQSPPSSLPNAK